MRSYRHFSLVTLILSGSVLLAVTPALPADVTPERLASPEPGNWLMNHRTYDAQRYSPPSRVLATERSPPMMT